MIFNSYIATQVISFIHEQVLIDLFVKGLPTKEMRRHVHLSRPSSLTAAVTLATTCEAFEDGSDAERLRKPKAEVTSVQPAAAAVKQTVATVDTTGAAGDASLGAAGDASLMELVKAM